MKHGIFLEAKLCCGKDDLVLDFSINILEVTVARKLPEARVESVQQLANVLLNLTKFVD